jgi:hypothetical protein
LHELAVFTEDLDRSGRQCRIVRATPATRRLIGLANYAPLLQLDGSLADPHIACAAEKRPPLPARPARPEPPEPPTTTAGPGRPRRRRAREQLLQTPTGAAAGHRGS